MRGDSLNRRSELLWLLGVLVLYFGWFAWPLIWSASSDARMVAVFISDEAYLLNALRDSIDKGTLNLTVGHYGHLYLNVALLPLLVLSRFVEVSEQQIIVTLRLVASLFAIGTVMVTFQLARRYFGPLSGWLSAFLLLIVPLNFLIWSVRAHPDITQLFFFVLSVYFVCRFLEEERTNWLKWASVSAGFAFASKFGGWLLLPMIWMVGIFHAILRGRDLLSGEIRLARFVTILRCALVLIGVLSISIGIFVTPDSVERYFSPDGEIEHPLFKPFMYWLPITTISLGCTLAFLSILGFLWSKLERLPVLATVLYRVSVSLVAFGLALALSSPYLLTLRDLKLVRGYLAVKEASAGFPFKATASELV